MSKESQPLDQVTNFRADINWGLQEGPKAIASQLYRRGTFANSSLEEVIDYIDMRIGHRSSWYEAPPKDTHYYLGQRFPGLNTSGNPLEVNSLTEYGQSSYKEQYRTYHMKVQKELASASEKMTPAENEYANKTMTLLLSHLEYGTLRKSWDMKKQHNEDRGGFSEQDEKNIMTRYYDNAKIICRICKSRNGR